MQIFSAHRTVPCVTLKDIYVLISAFEDGTDIVPVKLEVKEFIDKDNSLHVAIALERIKKDEVVKQGNTEFGVTQNSRSSNIRIADLFSKINPKDTSFLKYVPIQFFDALKEDDFLHERTETEIPDMVQYQSRKGEKQNNTKNSAASPLSRGLAAQGSVGKTSKLTAAAENLGITESLTSIPNTGDGLREPS